MCCITLLAFRMANQPYILGKKPLGNSEWFFFYVVGYSLLVILLRNFASKFLRDIDLCVFFSFRSFSGFSIRDNTCLHNTELESAALIHRSVYQLDQMSIIYLF